ncbi:MAG: DUF3574 domain-containing protein [Tepidisphaeraceae bacterium]
MRIATLLTVALLLTGCAAPHEPLPNSDVPQGVSSLPQTRTTLFFGLSRADGSVVSDQQWSSFVDQEIAPRFPDGFTILTGEGHWMSQSVDQREPSRVVIILHPDTRVHSELIDVIRERYKTLFHQESVLRVDDQPRYTCY